MDKILGHIDFLITQNCNYRCFYCSQSKKFITGNFEEADDDTINGFLNFLEKNQIHDIKYQMPYIVKVCASIN